MVRELKVTIFEDKLIPAIAAHGDYLAGRPSLITHNRPEADSSIVNYAISQSLDHLGEVYEVKAAIYPTATTSARHRSPAAADHAGSAAIHGRHARG